MIESSVKMHDGCGAEVEVYTTNHPEQIDDQLVIRDGDTTVQVWLGDKSPHMLNFLISQLTLMRERRDGSTLEKVAWSDEVLYDDQEHTIDVGDQYRMEPKFVARKL